MGLLYCYHFTEALPNDVEEGHYKGGLRMDLTRRELEIIKSCLATESKKLFRKRDKYAYDEDRRLYNIFDEMAKEVRNLWKRVHAEYTEVVNE